MYMAQLLEGTTLGKSSGNVCMPIPCFHSFIGSLSLSGSLVCQLCNRSGLLVSCNTM